MPAALHAGAARTPARPAGPRRACAPRPARTLTCPVLAAAGQVGSEGPIAITGMRRCVRRRACTHAACGQTSATQCG